MYYPQYLVFYVLFLTFEGQKNTALCGRHNVHF